MARARTDRLSFAKIPEVHDLPNLLAVQHDSFSWFLDHGLKQIFGEVSPIEDFPPEKWDAIIATNLSSSFHTIRAATPHQREQADRFRVELVMMNALRRNDRGLYWPQAHNNVIRTILGKAKHGTRVVYIPGNHDEVFRDYDGVRFGNLSIHLDYIHTTADGRRLLLLHGDEFDSVVTEIAKMAIDDADVVLFLVDGKVGPMAWDESIARELRRKGSFLFVDLSSSSGGWARRGTTWNRIVRSVSVTEPSALRINGR